MSISNSFNASLASLQKSINKGILPSVNSIVNATPAVDPSTPQAQQYMAKVAKILPQAGAEGKLRLQEVENAQALRQINNVTGSLKKVSSNLDPGSPQAGQLKERLAAIQQLKNKITAQYQTELSKDPSHGKSTRFTNPPGNGG